MHHLIHLTFILIYFTISKHIQSSFEDMLQCTAFTHKTHPLSTDCVHVIIY